MLVPSKKRLKYTVFSLNIMPCYVLPVVLLSEPDVLLATISLGDGGGGNLGKSSTGGSTFAMYAPLILPGGE